jgi:type II secretory pathway pseudopilin PulG
MAAYRLGKKAVKSIKLAIIGIIAIISVPNYFRSAKQARYEVAVTNIVSIIKDARNTSIVGKFTGIVGAHTTPKGGYGIFVDKTTGTLISFIDDNEDQTYIPADDTLISTYNLPAEISIKTMTGSQATAYTGTPDTHTNFSTALILFKPPQGETILNENDTTKELIDLFITLERFDQNKSKILKINKISGFIETE